VTRGRGARQAAGREVGVRVASTMAAWLLEFALYWLFAVPAVLGWAARLPGAGGQWVRLGLYTAIYSVVVVTGWALLVRPLALTPMRPFGGRPPGWPLAAGAAVLIAGALAATLRWNRGLAGTSSLEPSAHVPAWLFAGAAFAIVACAEELTARGALLGALRRAMGVAPAILVGGALFALLHVGAVFLSPQGAGTDGLGQLGLDGITGCALGVIAWRSGSLVVPMLAHWLFDWQPWRPVHGGGPAWFAGSAPWLVLLAAAIVVEAVRLGRRPARSGAAPVSRGAPPL